MHRAMDAAVVNHAYLFAVVSNQVHEMDLVRRKIFELEQAQHQIKQKSVCLLRSAPSGHQVTVMVQIRRGEPATTTRTRGTRRPSHRRSYSGPSESRRSRSSCRPRPQQPLWSDHDWRRWPRRSWPRTSASRACRTARTGCSASPGPASRQRARRPSRSTKLRRLWWPLKWYALAMTISSPFRFYIVTNLLLADVVCFAQCMGDMVGVVLRLAMEYGHHHLESTGEDKETFSDPHPPTTTTCATCLPTVVVRYTTAV